MYVQLDGDYYDHPKTLHLISLIGPEADVYPPRLWTWALKYAKLGVLKSPHLLEVACRWKGDRGALHKAMMEAGFLETDGVTLHGWMDRTGNDIIRYEEKKSRLKARYRNSSGNLPEICRNSSGRIRESSGNFRESSAVSELNGTELNGTKRNGADRSSPSGLLASHYCSKNKGIISFEKAEKLCQFFLDGGGNFQAAEASILNGPKGMKIWEILDPIRPPPTNGIPSMDKILENFAKEMRGK